MAGADLRRAYGGRRVLVTGHTGFKGSWLVSWLAELGAEVTGLALAPPAGEPAMFTLLDLVRSCRSHEGDIRDLALLRALVRSGRPEVIFHLAAQPLVRRSYDHPLETFDVNVRGTATVLEALRLERHAAAVVVVTSDKCYRNRNEGRAWREDDALGGDDPYSASKAAAELVVESYRRSFFAEERLAEHGVAIATARAGNVIGGGDWGHERLFPAVAAALAAGAPVELRAPAAIRPWQHVLDPLSGYLELGARLGGFDLVDDGASGVDGASESARHAFAGAWNFGPGGERAVTVAEVVAEAARCWTTPGAAQTTAGARAASWRAVTALDAKREAATLRLDCRKAASRLGWQARLDLTAAVALTVDWYRAFHAGAGAFELRALTRRQIADHATAATAPVEPSLRRAS